MANPAAQPLPPDTHRLMEVLRFVAELGQVVASSTEMQPILDWMVTRTTALLGADEGCIRLSDPAAASQGGQTLLRRHRDGVVSGSWPRAVAMSVEGYLMHRGEHIASPDLLEDPRFPGLRGTESSVRSILAVPLKVENHMTGVLAVTQSRPGRQWNESEVQLLGIVAGNSAGVIEQARLKLDALEHRRIAEEHERLERELASAREIQMRFVPSALMTAGPWELMGRVVPARQVGGDAFDYFPIGTDRVGVAIADVSGKGVPAALLMSSFQSQLRAFCDGRAPVRDAIRQLNQGVARSASGKFITMFYGELTTATGALRFANAGHNFPLLRRADGTIEHLEEGGLPLGLFDQVEYQEGRTLLGAGDALLLYSDGITEAVDLLGREFGEQRLADVWRALSGRASAEVIEHVMREVETYRGPGDQKDDMTLVVMAPAAAR